MLDLQELLEKFPTGYVPEITICGSYKFIGLMRQTETYFKEKGFIVNVPRKLDVPNGDTISDYTAQSMHNRKIRESDAIVVVDKDGYIGESTGKEIEYATLLGKPVYYSFKPADYDVDKRYIGIETLVNDVLDGKL